jgi:hypothetical protein
MQPVAQSSGIGNESIPDYQHHFDFDLDRGIREQVVEKLEASPLLPLTKGVGPPDSEATPHRAKGHRIGDVW